MATLAEASNFPYKPSWEKCDIESKHSKQESLLSRKIVETAGIFCIFWMRPPEIFLLYQVGTGDRIEFDVTLLTGKVASFIENS